MPQKLPRAVILTQAAVGRLASPPGLSMSASLLLWHLVRTLPVGGAHLSLTDLADVLGISRVHLTNEMRRLLETGFVVRGTKEGRLYRYDLNPAHFRFL